MWGSERADMLAVKEGRGTIESIQRAVEAAEKGMKGTVPMVAHKGRASYLGERSRDHQDPGATSMYLILKAFAEAAQ